MSDTRRESFADLLRSWAVDRGLVHSEADPHAGKIQASAVGRLFARRGRPISPTRVADWLQKDVLPSHTPAEIAAIMGVPERRIIAAMAETAQRRSGPDAPPVMPFAAAVLPEVLDVAAVIGEMRGMLTVQADTLRESIREDMAVTVESLFSPLVQSLDHLGGMVEALTRVVADRLSDMQPAPRPRDAKPAPAPRPRRSGS